MELWDAPTMKYVQAYMAIILDVISFFTVSRQIIQSVLFVFFMIRWIIQGIFNSIYYEKKGDSYEPPFKLTSRITNSAFQLKVSDSRDFDKHQAHLSP